MGEAIITRREGGTALGGAQEVTLISVIYPEGLTCTCTDGTTILTASDTSGIFIFNIPHIGTWTIEATYGIHTTSETVEITTMGQDVSVELKYAFNFLTTSDGIIDGYSLNGRYISPAIDVTPFSTMTINGYVIWALAVDYGHSIGLSETGSGMVVSAAFKADGNSLNFTKTIDLRSLSGLYYVTFSNSATMNGNAVRVDTSAATVDFRSITFS
jgi:hypothetical protein